MYCDYNELENYASSLNTTFNKINSIMDSLEESYKNICNTSNWNSETRNYFYAQTKSILENMESITNKFYNIKTYLNNVVANYRKVDSGISNYFKF